MYYYRKNRFFKGQRLHRKNAILDTFTKSDQIEGFRASDLKIPNPREKICLLVDKRPPEPNFEKIAKFFSENFSNDVILWEM